MSGGGGSSAVCSRVGGYLPGCTGGDSDGPFAGRSIRGCREERGGCGHPCAGAGLVGAVVGGGQNDVASGDNATVPGGLNNTAHGKFSLAAGQRAKALGSGTFVWADGQPLGNDF